MNLIVIAVAIATSLIVDVARGGGPIGCVVEEGWERCFSEADGEALAWKDALNACAAKGEQLATPSTPPTNNLVKQYLNKIEESSTTGLEYSVWVGASEDGDPVWRWASDQSEFKVRDNGTVVVANFSQVPKLFENCGLMSAAAAGGNGVRLRSQLCRRAFAYVCQSNVTADGNCKQPDIRIGTRCYSAVREPASWFDAINSCASKGSKLAELGAELGSELGTELANLTQLLEGGNYWVGLRRQPWVWTASAGRLNNNTNDTTSTRPMETFHWMGDGQPDLAMHDCVSYAVSPNDVGWKSENCAGKRSYVCEKTRLIPTTAAAILTTQSVANSNNNNNGTTSIGNSTFVRYVLPATLMIGAFLLVVALFVACHAYNRRQKGYKDIKN